MHFCVEIFALTRFVLTSDSKYNCWREKRLTRRLVFAQRHQSCTKKCYGMALALKAVRRGNSLVAECEVLSRKKNNFSKSLLGTFVSLSTVDAYNVVCFRHAVVRHCWQHTHHITVYKHSLGPRVVTLHVHDSNVNICEIHVKVFKHLSRSRRRKGDWDLKDGCSAW